MKTEINPQDSNRQEAFNLWMSSPMPMVTLVKTMEVTKLLRYSKKRALVKRQAKLRSSMCCPSMASYINMTAWLSM